MSSTLGHNLAQEKCTPPTRCTIWLKKSEYLNLLKNVRLQQLVHNSRDISAAGLNVCGIDAEFNSEPIPHGPGGDG